MDQQQVNDIYYNGRPPLAARVAADQGSNNVSNMNVIPPSPPQQTTAFRSQRITQVPSLAPPLLQQPVRMPVAAPKMKPDESLAMANKKEAVGSIPLMPSFHIPERTAIQLPEDSVSVSLLLDRLLLHLRDNSITYECERDTGCFDCMSSSMVGFAIQLYRRNSNTGKQLQVEVQRREGCAIALNAIRRSLLRDVQGEAQPPVSANSRRRPFSDSQNSVSNKRRRSLSPHTARFNCQDALSIGVRLLESNQADQQKLGLESLNVLTDARLVAPHDAAAASRALVFGEGPAGARLQLRMGQILRQNHVLFYHIALHVLSNALQQATRDNLVMRIDLASPFWQTAVNCLLFSLQDAGSSPHLAAMAAKCVRYLLPARAGTERLLVPSTQTVLQRNHDLGRAHHRALQEESQKTLCFF